MIAAKYNLSFTQGDVLSLPITLKQPDGNPIDLTGYTGAAMIRKLAADTNPTATFTVTFVDRPNGKVTISLTPTQTGGITAGSYLYDFELTPGSGDRQTYLYGEVIVLPQITR